MFASLPSCLTLLLLNSAGVLLGYPQYRDQIPNGYNVPNPCNASEIWRGVGHRSPLGGGDRNPFGLDFDTNGHVWTQALCKADSDGDGKTNGQELGDPECQWTSNEIFKPSATGLSHPGVCEPVGSPKCAGNNSNWFECGDESDDSNSSCKNELQKPGVEHIDLRMPNISVSSNYTSYVCHYASLPTDQKYHAIAAAPLLDDYTIIHHILILSCSEGDVPPPTFNGTWECMMLRCTQIQILAGYGFGQDLLCLSDKYGVPFGAGNYAKQAIIQVHYTNTKQRTGIVDSSGLRVYYTANLRPNDGGVMRVVQYYLAIPPRQPAYVQSGYCSEECTQMMAGPINITDVYLHMHLTGIWINVTLYRSGLPVKRIVSAAFNYKTPQLVSLAQEEPFYPGDELRVDCVFNTSDRTNYTYYGIATVDEMCTAMLVYYPLVPVLPTCAQWKNYSICNNRFVAPGCNMTAAAAVVRTLATYQCNYQLGCSEPCVTSLVSHLADTGCLEGDIPEFLVFALQSPTLRQLMPLITDCYDMSRTTPITIVQPTSDPTSSGARIFANVSIFGIVVSSHCFFLSILSMLFVIANNYI